jgi:hypothetical protein
MVGLLPTIGEAAGQGAVWAPALIPGVRTDQAPNAEDFNGKLYVAILAQGEPGTIQLSATALHRSGPAWATRIMKPTAEAASSIAIRAWKSRLWLAFRARDSKVYVSSSANGAGWAPWVSVAGSENGHGAPSLKGVGSSLYIAAQASTGLTGVAQRTQFRPWGGLKAVPGMTSRFRPALTEYKGKLTLGVSGADNRIYLTTSPNGLIWSGWRPLPGLGIEDYHPRSAGSGPSLTVWKGRLYVGLRVIAYDTESHLLLTSYDGMRWSAWGGPSHSIESEPSLTTAAGHEFIVVQQYGGGGIQVERRR